jgi:hypothetical protein
MAKTASYDTHRKTVSLDDKMKALDEKVTETNTLMVLGFKILLIMVATLIIAYFSQIFISYNALIDKVNTLQVQLNSKH